MPKKLYCRACNQEIKLGENRVIFQGYADYFEAYHKSCLKDLIKWD